MQQSCLWCASRNCTIARNLLGNCTTAILATVEEATFEGNLVGTDASGRQLASTVVNNCIHLYPGASGSRVIDNVAAGCGGYALLIQSNSAVVQGNRIGTDISGTTRLDSFDGIGMSPASFGCVIGGPLPHHANVISGSSLSGIGISSDGNLFQGNFIGTDRSGSSVLGNNGMAVVCLGANNRFLDNVIAGNGEGGVDLRSGAENTTLQGNKIGVGADGTRPLPNLGPGVLLFSAKGALFGGEAAGDANVIAHNRGAGIELRSGAEARILGNSIHSNDGLGIDDLASSDVQLDLVGATDAAVTAAVRAESGGRYIIEVFSSEMCEVGGAGERLVARGDAVLANGTLSVVDVPLDEPAEPGMQLTAIVTSATRSSTFSACLQTTNETSACRLCQCRPASTGGVEVDCSGRGLRSIPIPLPQGTTRLLMAGNTLSFMHLAEGGSPRLESVPELRHLDLSNTGLTTLPSGLLAGLPNLKSLLVAGNHLTSLAGVPLRQLPALQSLDASFNLLRAVPGDLAQSPRLRAVQLRGNLIADIPERAFAQSSLLAVDVAENPIASIAADAFVGSRGLQTIDLGRAGASETPTMAAETFAALPSLGAINWVSSECPAGFGAGFASSGLQMCLRCPTGTHKPSGPGSLLACVPCPAGSTDHDGDPVTPCLPCGPGEYVAPGSVGSCDSHACPAGTIDADLDASTPCNVCRPGTYTPAGRAGSCPACVSGTTDRDTDASTPCVVCGNGTAAPADGIGECIFQVPEEAQSRDSAAIVVGAVLGCLVLLAIALAIVLRQRQQKERAVVERQLHELQHRVHKKVSLIRGLPRELTAKKLRALEVPRDRVQVQTDQVLGEGQFGVVARGRFLDGSGGSVPVAVKTLRSNVVEEQEQFLLEAQLTGMLEHPRIVKVLGLCSGQVPILAVLEHMAGGDLRSYLLAAQTPTPTSLLLKVGWQISAALGFLKQVGVIHRDLAARNILVGENLEDVKLSDFGMSKSLQEGKQYFRNTSRELVPVRWVAPESLQNKVYTHYSDVWSFGVVLWEVLSRGKTPYTGMTAVETAMAVGVGKRLPMPAGCPESVYQLMLDMWKVKPSERVSIAVIQDTLVNVMSEEASRRASKVDRAPPNGDAWFGTLYENTRQGPASPGGRPVQRQGMYENIEHPASPSGGMHLGPSSYVDWLTDSAPGPVPGLHHEYEYHVGDGFIGASPSTDLVSVV